MIILRKSDLWMILFCVGLLYWLFNPSAIMSLVMIVPLLLAAFFSK